ncbi:MAG: hypothetical protein JJU05_08070 [Verrucomicrobia bacterium]|nr:hypothetical protein [Verrucomicrobiota bacterium]MCH8527529.1 hypothetical protein [Kiritimatiellia bacterium]
MQLLTRLAAISAFFGLMSCVRPPEPPPHTEPEVSPEEHPDTPPPPVENRGHAVWEFWRDGPGDSLQTALNSPRWNEPPTRRMAVHSLESGRDLLDDFAVRISGNLIPPQTGAYTFILHVKGEALLRVGSDEMLQGADGEHRGEPVSLEAGVPVAFELLHIGGRGPDALRAGWSLPDGTEEMPLGGDALAAAIPLETLRADNFRRVHIDNRLRTYDAERHMALHPHNPRPGEHIVRETFYTAGALLESDDPEEHAEALRALRAVIGLQNTYEPSSSYGNWPRVVQQPGNFNAQNIGGFIGAEIIMILQRHPDKLPEDLHTALRDALRHAAHRSRRYNPPVTATNIITKAVAVALTADAMLDIPEARAWGENALRRLHAHTLEAGMPTEYNSPTYNRVSLEALSLLRAYYQHDELSPLIDELYHITWRELILNYHPNLQLWVGNASRSYDGITHPGARLQEATDFAHFFGELSAARLPSPLPEEFLSYLSPLTEPGTRIIPVLGGGREANIIFQESPVPLVSTLYLDPAYALASFNRGDLWNQRRALTLTWGRRDHAGHLTLASPSGAQGLLAAQTAAVQQENRMLLILNFATDAGWGQHPWELYGIDREAPARTIADARARFQTLGSDPLRFELHPRAPRLVTARAEGMTLRLRLLDGAFGTQTPRWEISREGHLDLLMHTGESVNLHEIDTAYAALALEIVQDESDPFWLTSVRARAENGLITLQADAALALRAAARPASYADLQAQLLFKPQPGDTP